MKLVKIIVSVGLGRIIHAGVKAAFPLTTNDPDTAFLVGGAAGAGSMLLGFAIVFGLSGYLRKRNKTSEAKTSGHERLNQ
jgi:hypothetical protein